MVDNPDKDKARLPKKTRQPRCKKEVHNGEIVVVRKGLPRSNKPVILPEKCTWLKQPNIITLMSADLKTTQLRALIGIIEQLQSAIEESIKLHEKNPNNTQYSQLTLFQEHSNNIVIKLSYKDLGVSPDQYNIVKQMLRSLVNLPVELETVNPETNEELWTVQGLIAKAHISKATYRRYCTVEIDRDVAKAFVNVDKGFTRYIKEIAYKSQSKYTIRMYMLISSWKDRGSFSINIDKLRKYLKLENKYPHYKDFYRWVIKPVYEELFEKANCWFDVAEVYKNPSDPEPYKLNFKVTRSEMTKKEKEHFELLRQSVINMCSLHFHMKPTHLSKLGKLITPENIPILRNKMLYLNDYIQNNWKSITSIPDYALEVLIKEITLIPGNVDGDDEIYGTEITSDF